MDPLRDERRLANRYIAGLLIIVLLIAGAGFLIDRLVRAEHNTAEIIELAGRQQMLSQRITQLAFRYALADNRQEAHSLHGRLSVAAREMRRTHETLLKSPPAPGYADAADTIYFDPPYRLDARVRRFLGAVRGLLDAFDRRGLDSPYLEHLRDREGTLLLQGLERVVERHVQQSQIAMDRLQWVLWGLFATILLIIALLGILIFRPAVARLMARTLELHREAGTDPLTGSQNRRGFFTWAEALHQRLRRGRSLCPAAAGYRLFQGDQRCAWP
ncbi:type IV pili methyl-accepting chemotaxis transducer N-terminal domain-containing protein [Fodinicurvata halophila]|uniref:type IV pili methyl-accepting chemotaxis transducer N-terminal domain-containing protein n=1 Tax=Fodinicurvata halophila TaxID=1419723 RepID=UPI0036375986